jgi:hypothetical protein
VNEKMMKKKMIRRKCEVWGEEKDATTYLDAWDGVRVVHNVNVGNRGRETILCHAHNIFNSKRYEDGLVEQMQMKDLGDAIRYGDALDDKLLE